MTTTDTEIIKELRRLLARADWLLGRLEPTDTPAGVTVGRPPGLTQRAVVRALWNAGGSARSISALAGLLGVSRNPVRRVVDQLAKLGCVELEMVGGVDGVGGSMEVRLVPELLPVELVDN